MHTISKTHSHIEKKGFGFEERHCFPNDAIACFRSCCIQLFCLPSSPKGVDAPRQTDGSSCLLQLLLVFRISWILRQRAWRCAVLARSLLASSGPCLCYTLHATPVQLEATEIYVPQKYAACYSSFLRRDRLWNLPRVPLVRCVAFAVACSRIRDSRTIPRRAQRSSSIMRCSSFAFARLYLFRTCEYSSPSPAFD